MKVCPHCYVAILRQHPEFVWWTKCCFCGYCELPIDGLSEKNKKLALASPFTKHHLAAAIQAIELDRIRRDKEDLVIVSKKQP